MRESEREREGEGGALARDVSSATRSGWTPSKGRVPVKMYQKIMAIE